MKHNQKNNLCKPNLSGQALRKLARDTRETVRTPMTEMGRPFNTSTTHTNRINNTQIKFLKINLINSRDAKSNPLKIVDEDGTDVVCIQDK